MEKISLFIVQIGGYIRNEVMELAQQLLYSKHACGSNSGDPTVVYHTSDNGYEIPIITNIQLPVEVQDNLKDFVSKYKVTGEETPESPGVFEFEFSGYQFEARVIGLIKGYTSDGKYLYNQKDLFM